MSNTSEKNSEAVAIVHSGAEQAQDAASRPFELRVRTVKRRPSQLAPPASSLKSCGPVPQQLEPFDRSSRSAVQTLASIRFLVLSHLADVEQRLSEVNSPTFDDLKQQGESRLEEVTQWAHTALEMLEGIRTDVCSQIPEFQLVDMSSIENFVKSHLPDLPEMPNFSDMRAHFPDMPQLPDMSSHLEDMRHKLDDVRSRLHEIDFHQPLSYVPTLSTHIKTLHSHLSDLASLPDQPFPSLTPSTFLSDLLDAVLNSEVVTDILNNTPDADSSSEEETVLEQAASEVMDAIRKSFNGMQLIQYSDLPHHWKNNPFVTDGYRFIPLEQWPLLVKSLFALHNETLNIHTHLIPFCIWFFSLLPYFTEAHPTLDTPEILFTSFALLCLFSSALWHTMSGCADHRSMDFCARVDYIGIGWLISASVGTVIHFGFREHPTWRTAFLSFCFLNGLAGNIFPFMSWFNQHKYRWYRMAFFISMIISGLAPMFFLGMLHSFDEAYSYISHIFPSLGSYAMGLFFYAYHVPERFLPPSVRRKLDIVGGNSHAIWHCFIVLAVSQHKDAIKLFRLGVQCNDPSHDPSLWVQ